MVPLRRQFVDAHADAPKLCARIVAKLKAMYHGEAKLRAQGLLGSEAHQRSRATCCHAEHMRAELLSESDKLSVQLVHSCLYPPLQRSE